jgi:hypothetical protein
MFNDPDIELIAVLRSGAKDHGVGHPFTPVEDFADQTVAG